ncbi:hypothetical protein P7C71_g6144, partial [Lecanoromycetidae sp. Uapishka_2]
MKGYEESEPAFGAADPSMDYMETYQEYEPTISVPQTAKDSEWERKQRNREYRVAARREKRNRKADEKKQRKLNATILRRMTRNPDKYNKNAERNRLRDIEGERRRIYQEAVRQAQRLAAIHDPSGAMFNVSAVVTQEDGTVISLDTLRRREDRAREKAAAEQAKKENIEPVKIQKDKTVISTTTPDGHSTSTDNLNPDRLARIEGMKPQQPPSRLSKTQQKKRAALEPRPAPPKPVIPTNILLPEGEEDWLALWDLSDDQLERRVLREKKRKAAERKALRVKQKSGKAERRIARDEKRKVYREIKLTWKAIKEEQTREKTKLKAIEDEESKKIAVDINDFERKAALDLCTALGFTLDNTPGVDEIKPRALGMKGVEVDFDAIEIGERRSDVKPKQSNKRVNLGDAPEDIKAEYVPAGEKHEAGDIEEFIELDIGEGQEFEALNYNHKLRRKLRRAMDNAQIRKEMLVRERALDHYKDKGMEAPATLKTPYKPVNVKGQRILDNGMFETAKQERVRARMELAEFNTQMRVLRKQAKEAAIYAGLRKHAEVTGKVSSSETPTLKEETGAAHQANSTDLPSALEIAATTSADVKLSWKRSGSDSDESTSSDSENLSGTVSEASVAADDTFASDLSSSCSEEGPRKRQKLQSCEGNAANKQSESTNSDRQAMIDAESAKKVNPIERGNKKMPNASGSLQEVNINGDRKSQWRRLAKGANAVSNWNINGLPGDRARKSKFLRLLGGEKLGHGEGVENEDDIPEDDRSARMNAELEKQYRYGMAHKKDSVRKGLGS